MSELRFNLSYVRTCYENFVNERDPTSVWSTLLACPRDKFTNEAWRFLVRHNRTPTR